jgi:hypothetical protein
MEGGKKYPHRPYADGGQPEKGSMSELSCSRQGFTIANAIPRTNPPVSPATKTIEGKFRPSKGADSPLSQGHRTGKVPCTRGKLAQGMWKGKSLIFFILEVGFRIISLISRMVDIPALERGSAHGKAKNETCEKDTRRR